MQNKPKFKQLPLFIATFYVVISALWIVFSDKLVEFLVSEESLTVAQTYKGFFFITATGFFFYYTVKKYANYLVQRDRFYSNLLNDAHIGIVEFTDYKIVYSNKIFKDIFQFNEKILNLNLVDLVYSSSVSDVKRAIAFVNMNKSSITIQVKPQAQADNWYSLIITNVKRDDENHYYGVVSDISSSKKFDVYTEILLKIILAIDSKKTLQQTFETIIQHLIHLTSAHHAVLYINQANSFRKVSTSETDISEHISDDLLNKIYTEKTSISELELSGLGVIFIPLTDNLEQIGLLVLAKPKNEVKNEDELTLFRIISNDIGIKLKQKLDQYKKSREEENQRLLLDYAKVATWEIEVKSGKVNRSPNHSTLIELDSQKDSWTQDKFYNTVFDEDVDKLKTLMNNLNSKNSSFELEFRVKKLDGNLKWIYSSGKYSFDEVTQRELITGISMDIHERKVNEELLKASEKTYRDLFQNNPAPLMIIDPENLQILGVNQAVLFLYGYSELKFLGMTLFDLSPKNEHQKILIPRELVEQYGFFRIGLWRHLKITGQQIYLDISVAMIEFKGKPSYIIMANEVTNVILSQEALSRSESKYRTLFQENPQPLLILDQTNELIIDVNQTASNFFGLPKSEIIQRSIQELLGNRVGLEVDLIIERLSKESVVRTESRFMLNEQSERIVEITAAKTEVDSVLSVILFINDITDAKKAEQKAIRAFIEGEDRERERMAKELHDSLGQVLTAASMNLKSAQKELNEIDFKRKEQFGKGVAFIQQAIEETRTIAQNLMPKTIADFGLISSLELLIASYKDTLPFNIDLVHNLPQNRLDRVLELNVYRIIQEALTNIIKYAKATQAMISIEYNEQQLRIEIKDDGIGMDLENNLYTNGIGLKNMKSRVKIMSGEFFIDSIPMNGTTITALIPIHHE